MELQVSQPCAAPKATMDTFKSKAICVVKRHINHLETADLQPPLLSVDSCDGSAISRVRQVYSQSAFQFGACGSDHQS